MEILEYTIALFDDPFFGVSVIPIVQGVPTDDVEIAENTGILDLSLQDCVKVTGFQLVLHVPKGERAAILQRNLTRTHRDYDDTSLLTLSEESWNIVVLLDHIVVSRENGISWTHWTGEVRNVVDYWTLDKSGVAKLFQPGVIARGEGDNFTFRLIGEMRGEWQLFRFPNGNIDGIPTKTTWGSFQIRRAVLNHAKFAELVKQTELPIKNPRPQELNPPLPTTEKPGHGVMQWYSPYAGKRGQGPCTLHDGSSVWVCGEDVVEAEPDEDDIIRLPRGTLVSYEEIEEVAGKGDTKLRKLLRVRRESPP